MCFGEIGISIFFTFQLKQSFAQVVLTYPLSFLPMAASLSGLSASVTRILYLTGFPKELKTKDIQAAFSDYESMSGGFKIKWRDDTSLLIVFQDASVGEPRAFAP